MTNSRYDVEINGDNRGLTRAVNKSMDELNKLDSAAQGLFKNFTGPLNGLKDGIGAVGQLSPALRALGVAGVAAGAGLMAIQKAADIVNPLNEISKSTGVSVEMLQQLKKEFKETGLEIDKFGDFNKDALDKIGDSLREGGGGIADDLEKWGISLERYIQYANDAEGGIKAVVQTFYDMREAGKSHAEITNAMESLASDSSHLITTLDRYKNSQEALNAIQGQTASVTNETAREFAEYQKNIESLSSKVDQLTVDSMGPLVREINNVWEWFDKDWANTKFVKNLDKLNKQGVSPSGMSSGQVQNIGKGPKELEKEKNDALLAERLKGQTVLLNADMKGAKKRIADERLREQYEKQKLEKQKEENKKAEAERERAANKARSDAERAQREREAQEQKAKAAYERMMQDRRQSLEQLSQLDIAVISSEQRALASQMNQLQQTITKIDELQQKGIITSEQAAERRNSLLKNSAKEFKDAIAMNPADIGAISQSLDIIYQQQLEQLEAKKSQALIGQEEYNRQLESIQTDYKSRQAAMQGIDGNLTNYQNLSTIGFSTDEQSMALQQAQLDEQFNKFREENQALYDGELISYDDFLKQKEALDRAYAAKSQNISMMEAQTKMGIYNNMASGMAGVIAGISGENSKASQAAFAVAKGTAIAQGMLNAYQSATTAMATYPGPLGYALAASSYASVLGQVMSMKSIQPSGIAHDGITEIPREGTWLLDGGERVVDERTNGDLKDFLNKENQGSQPIDARIIVNGNVTDQRWFAEQLKKQEKNLTAIVQSGNRRKM